MLLQKAGSAGRKVYFYFSRIFSGFCYW